jgi:hypothetical protein
MQVDWAATLPYAEEVSPVPMSGAQTDRGQTLATVISELQEYFDSCDTDYDGRIRYEEFLRLLAYLGARSTNSECDRWFRNMDSDHDGFIDLHQFVAGWMD